MVADTSPHAVLDELAGHPRGDDLARLVHTVCFAMADERRPDFGGGLSEAAVLAGISHEDAETKFGNVLRSLERSELEGSGTASRMLLAVLLARGVALSPPEGAEAEERVAEALLWLATNTQVDALSALDAALGPRAGGLWQALGAILRRADAGVGGGKARIGRAGALVAAAALRQSAAPAARAEVNTLADDVRDPIVRSLLRASAAGARGSDAGSGTIDAAAEPVVGELVPAPRGPAMLVLLAVTGILPLLRLGRLIGRLVLRYRCPAELRVTSRGITVRAKTELLGRTLRERETHIPIESLLRATREIRYPRLGMYAGLFALAIGSYVGVSLFVDGARAGSPELLGFGALIVAVGIALDFVLVNVAGSARGRCRVVIVPRKGPAVAVGAIDPARADAALGRLART